MKVSYVFLKRKIEREFLIGVYPEFEFNWEEKRYCINADLDKFYIHFIKPITLIVFEYIEKMQISLLLGKQSAGSKRDSLRNIGGRQRTITIFI